jgi:hypothetical protein
MIFRYITHVLASLGFVSLSSAELCVDSPLNVIQGGGVYGCGDVTYLSSCESPGVKSHCPATCDACDEYACVDSERGFVYDGIDVKCSRLTNASAEDLEIYCSYFDVSSTCRGTCNFCTTPTPTPAPTMSNENIIYGDVLRLVNGYNPNKGYLKTYGGFSGIGDAEGYGVYTTQPLGLYDGVGEWELVKVLPDGSEEIGQLAHYGDVVKLLNLYDPTKPYLMTYGDFSPTEGYGVYTSQPAGLPNDVGKWELVKLLPDGSVVTGDVVQVGDVMRIRNLYDTNPNTYLMTYGDFSGIVDTEGYGVYTSLPAMLVNNVGDWVFEYFD